MRRDIVWEWCDRPGLEHLALSIGRDEIIADSVVVAPLGPELARLSYEIHCDAGWSLQRARLSLETGAQRKILEIERSDTAGWKVDGTPRAELEGCGDIDIMVTPFTNTLPIRRLDFAPGEPIRLRMAYVALPELSLCPLEQEYTRLDPAAPPRRFRYRNVGNGFAAELTVDHDGVVIDYPPFWRRRGG